MCCCGDLKPGFSMNPQAPCQIRRFVSRRSPGRCREDHQPAMARIARAMLLGHLTAVNGSRLNFADDLEENVRFGDETSERTRRSVDEYISSMGLEAPSPEPDPGKAVAWQTARTANPRSIWPIRASHRWSGALASPLTTVGCGSLFDASGYPRHDRGATASPGLYFLGLPWLSCRRSMLIAGVDQDARRIADWIAARCHAHVR